MKEPTLKIRYPRRLFVRRVLRGMDRILFRVLTRFEVTGKENLPRTGPLLLTINHFGFLDSAVVIAATDYPIEVLGGFQTPTAPTWAHWILQLWGSFPVRRGTGARDALRAAEMVLGQGGVLGVAPEGGAWAAVLRPPRPGAAYLAARTGARILPMGLEGTSEAVPVLGRGKRPSIKVRIGEPFGPFQVSGRGRERRRQLDEVGHEIMQHIARLIPPERRGYYSDDPDIRAAAKGTEIYPWADTAE